MCVREVIYKKRVSPQRGCATVDEQVLLLNMMLLLLLGGLCSVIFKKLKLPAIIGYLVCGIVIGNYWDGRSLETDAIIELLSSMGLVLMMFTIGTELNLNKMKKAGSFASMVVMINVPIIMIGGVLGGTMLLGLTSIQAITLGAIISASSTAVVTVILADQNRLDHGDCETIILIMVVEDVAQVIILSAISPMLNGEGMEIGSMIFMLITIAVFIVASAVVGMMLVPRLLDWIGKRMPDEILLIVALGLCFMLSWLSTVVGLSEAIGAFIMGVVVSQAKASKAITHDVIPMKNIFMMMFFISIGLVISPKALADNIIPILIIYGLFAILMFVATMISFFIGNKPLRKSFFSAVSLLAMGEFAFIISKVAFDSGAIDEALYTSIIGAALISIIVLPLLDSKVDKIADIFQNKTPQPIVNGFLKLERVRSNFYAKISFASKATMQNFRTRLTYVYFLLILMGLVEILFWLGSPLLSDFINENTPESVSYYMTTIIVMTVNFLLLLPILFRLVYNLKFIDRVLLDSERKARMEGQETSGRFMSKFARAIVQLNIWILVVLVDFSILLIAPNSVDFIGHVYVFVIGVVILSIVTGIRYLRRS